MRVVKSCFNRVIKGRPLAFSGLRYDDCNSHIVAYNLPHFHTFITIQGPYG